MTIYYNPKEDTPGLGPEIIGILHYVQTFFKGKTRITIVTKEDLAPITLPVCGDDRNKVIVFELWMGYKKKTQRTVLKELDICHDKSNFNSMSNSCCKCGLVVFATVCSLTLMLQKLNI